MMTDKQAAKILYDLRTVLPAEAVTAISALLEDLGSERTVGELARAGAAFSALGKALTEATREQALRRLRGAGAFRDDSVLFRYRPAYTRQQLDTKLIRDKFPPEEFGMFYVDVEVGETVTIRLNAP